MEEHRTIAKRSKIQIVQLIITAAILAVLIVIGVTFLSNVSRMEKTMTMIETDLQKLNMDEMNATISALKNAASQLGQVDMNSLNELITSLNNTATTLSNASNLLGGLFN